MIVDLEGNPLRSIWLEATGGISDYFELVRIDGDEVPIERRRWVTAHDARRAACSRYSWAIPNDEAISVLADLSPLVDVGAGTGYWARLLADAGADVVAYDEVPPAVAFDHDASYSPDEAVSLGRNYFHRDGDLYFPVEKATAAEAASWFSDRTLLLVWPPYSTPMAYEAASAYYAAGGKRIAYVGEPAGGCTASEDFDALLGERDAFCSACWVDEFDPTAPEREYLDEHTCSTEEPRYSLVRSVGIPQWPGIHDLLRIFERIPSTDPTPP